MSQSLLTRNPTLQTRDAISLCELEESASFLTRKDRKYLLSTELLEKILPHFDTRAKVLEILGQRSFVYISHYFDTEDHHAYFRALHARPDRFKVRVRHYHDSDLNFLEAKTRDVYGRTVKHRLNRDDCAVPDFLPGETQWLAEHRQIGDTATDLQHCITTTYSRTTMVLPGQKGRVTIDNDLVFSERDGESISLPSFVILESKGAGHPTSADRLLWRYGVRPVSMSKFACGVSLLSPELPSNRWHRVRTRLMQEAENALAPTSAQPHLSHGTQNLHTFGKIEVGHMLP